MKALLLLALAAGAIGYAAITLGSAGGEPVPVFMPTP